MPKKKERKKSPPPAASLGGKAHLSKAAKKIGCWTPTGVVNMTNSLAEPENTKHCVCKEEEMIRLEENLIRSYVGDDKHPEFDAQGSVKLCFLLARPSSRFRLSVTDR